jgi:hypothetical protein
MTDPAPGRVDDAAFHAMMRARLVHEDGLIVSRLAWLMASESFLFTAYAIVLNGAGTAQHDRLLKLIPVVAIASSALIFLGIVAAIRAIRWAQRLLRARVPDEAVLGLPPLNTPAGMVLAGLAAPVVLPLVFVAVWLYLLASRA